MNVPTEPGGYTLWRIAIAALAMAMAMAACDDITTTTTPNTGSPSGSPAASKQPTCPDRAIRLLDRSGSDIHGAIVDDTLHMGGESASATCQETADLSLLAGSPMPDGRAAQVQQSQYYLIVIRYPDGNNRLYVIRRASGTDCIVDTNDVCVATVSGLPDGFDPEEDLPDDVPPTIPGGQDAPPEQPDTDTKPDAVENPYPRNGKTGVTVAPLLSWAASPQAASYDLYYGTTKDLAGTPITTENTAVTIPRPGAADQRLAGDTTYYWRVDARNEAGATRGNVWSFTTEASEMEVPNVAGTYEGNVTWKFESPNPDVSEVATMLSRLVVEQDKAKLTIHEEIREVLSAGPLFRQTEWFPLFQQGGRIGTYTCSVSPDGLCRAKSVATPVEAKVSITFTDGVATFAYMLTARAGGEIVQITTKTGTCQKLDCSAVDCRPTPGPTPDPSPPPAPGSGSPSGPGVPEKRWTIGPAHFGDDGGAIWAATSNRSNPFAWDRITAGNAADVRVSVGGKPLPLENRARQPVFNDDLSGAEWTLRATVGAGEVVLLLTSHSNREPCATRPGQLCGNTLADNLYWGRQTLYGKQLLVQIVEE